jgi:hypothetical protein
MRHGRKSKKSGRSVSIHPDERLYWRRS